MKLDYRNLFAALLIVFLAGCTTLDRKPETVEEGLYLSASYLTTVGKQINAAYINREITKKQQLSALDRVASGLTYTQAGLNAFRAGNYSEATDQLSKTEAVLRSLQLLLSFSTGVQ